MYMDTVVFAGIATVLLMVAFFVGVGFFIVRDQKSRNNSQGTKKIKTDRESA